MFNRTSLTLILIKFIVFLNAFVTLAQATDTPTPRHTSTMVSTATFIPTSVMSQVDVLSTQVVELAEKVENPSRDLVDYLGALGGISTVIAAIIVAFLGNRIASGLENDRSEREQQHTRELEEYRSEQQQNLEHQRQKHEKERQEREQLQNANELKVAQAQVVQVLIPSLESDGNPRKVALTAISELGNESLSQKLIELYSVDEEDPEFAKQQLNQFRARLIRDADSRIYSIANKAIEDLRSYGWLIGEDGLLKGADLEGANLYGTNLRDANFEGASLRGSTLDMASLFRANLVGADLRWTNTERTTFAYANLVGANLISSVLDGADFNYATLPDGTQWSPDTDMRKFTNPNHPEFNETLEKINAIRVKMGIDTINP